MSSTHIEYQLQLSCSTYSGRKCDENVSTFGCLHSGRCWIQSQRTICVEQRMRQCICAGMDIWPDWSKYISRPHVPSFLMSQSCDTNWDVKHHKSPSNFCPDYTRLKTWSRHDNSNGPSMKVVWKWGHLNLMDFLKVVRWFSLFPHKKGYPIDNILSFQTSMLRKTTIGTGERHYCDCELLVVLCYSYIYIYYYYYYYYYSYYYCYHYYCYYYYFFYYYILLSLLLLSLLLLLLLLYYWCYYCCWYYLVLYIYIHYIMTNIIITMLLLLLSLSLLILYLVVSLLYANVPICVTCMHTSTSQY